MHQYKIKVFFEAAEITLYANSKEQAEKLASDASYHMPDISMVEVEEVGKKPPVEVVEETETQHGEIQGPDHI